VERATFAAKRILALIDLVCREKLVIIDIRGEGIGQSIQRGESRKRGFGWAVERKLEEYGCLI
jgi:hypothetical protein